MKIAVTGASGCIGSHVVNSLLDRGHDVVCIVRNINKNKFSDYQCDVVGVEIGEEDEHLFQELGRPDILLDLAWENLDDYMSLKHIEVTLPAHYNFIKNLVRSGLKSVVVTGTCFEYGLQNGSLSEGDEVKPINPYGYAKDALRRHLEFLKDTFEFNLTWMRLFYIFGDCRCNGLYSQLVRSIEEGQLRFDMSKGEQIRDYMSIDVLSASIAEITAKNENYGIVNVCSGNPVSIRALVESWKGDLKSDIELNLGYYKYPDHEPLCFWGDNSKLKSMNL